MNDNKITNDKIQKMLSRLKPIQCMGFKCKYAYPDEYNWAECEQDLRGYIISFVEKEERIVCPHYKEKDMKS